MNATDCKTCGTTAAMKKASSEYVPCLYERLFLIKSKAKCLINKAGRWKKRFFVALFLYGFLIALYHLMLVVFSQYINNSAPYDYAVYVVASIIFWPFIVIYDSELYYRSCQKLQCLLKDDAKGLAWYAECAQKYFCINGKGKSKSVLSICANTIFILLVITIFFLKVYVSKPIPLLTSSIALIICCPAMCLLIAGCNKENRNVLVIQSVICGGLSYYTYITEFANQTIPTLFSTNFVMGTILIVLLVCVVFFIAGTTIMPMLGLFKAFFLSTFEEKLQYPIDEIACSLSTIETIKRYFLHLTGVNLFAYFQLLGCVYFLGILNSDSIVTKVLFVIGAFFPVAMYLAASVFFKKLCRKIYIKQVKDIDTQIYTAVTKDHLEPDKIQALVSIKEMYANEFEIHAEMSKEILAVMLTPVVTALAAVILPASSVIGG